MSNRKFSHLKDLEIQAEFSKDKRFRYSLTLISTRLKKGKNLCVIMQNPSTANVLMADKSVQFLEKLVFEKKVVPLQNIKYLVIVNQFALIQTKNFKGATIAIGDKNDSIVEKSIKKADLVLIAWGKNNQYEERKLLIHSLLKKFPKENIFSTKKHPSRGTYSDFVVPYLV